MLNESTTSTDIDENQIEEIAVIGIACRFPGAKNKEEYWDNLCKGVCSIKTFAIEECAVSGEWLKNPNYVRRLGALDNKYFFDAGFFSYSPREAERMDPQQRILLECAWEALEDAGYIPDNCKGKVGVFAGAGLNYYLLKNILSEPGNVEDIVNVMTFINNEKDFLASRISYKLNLTGPSCTIQTACSTSLVAVHSACQSLLSYESDMAIAGGVSLQAPGINGYIYNEGEIFSPDGELKPFDKDANGTLFGEGAGLIILKRLSEAYSDGDNIYAVIKSTAINNDGSQKVGYTAPSVTGQAEVIRLAQNIAEVRAENITYIEAHGTGTQIGDPIEFDALTQTFRESTGRRNYCAIGSVKANIGHLDVAAGIAGLIKTILCIKHKTIPPQISYNAPNPKLNIDDSPFYINKSLLNWETEGNIPRLAGVSSFGMGGTNAHVILGESPRKHKNGEALAPALRIFNFSAKKPDSLLGYMTDFRSFLLKDNDLNLSAIAYSLAARKREFAYRFAAVCDDKEDLLYKMNEFREKYSKVEAQTFTARNIVFLFPGQGSDYVKMSYNLYHNDSVFRALLDECSHIVKEVSGIDILAIIFNTDGSGEAKLSETRYSQIALFVVEYSIAKYLIHLGIKPDALVGHSLGEITAACVAGVFNLKDALSFVIARGKALQDAPDGAMLAAVLNEENAKKYINDEVFIATINSDTQCVFSGKPEAILKLGNTLKQDGIASTLLKAKKPFHSPFLEPVIPGLSETLNKIAYYKPVIPVISNISGNRAENGEMQSPGYWENHILSPVRFKQGIDELLKLKNCIFIEAGPNLVLSSIVKSNVLFSNEHRCVNCLPRDKAKLSDQHYFYEAVGKCWESGISINWSNLNKFEKFDTVPLPSYFFDRQRFYIEQTHSLKEKNFKHAEAACMESGQSLLRDESGTRTISDLPMDNAEIIKSLFKETLGYDSINNSDNFFDLGGNSLIAAQIITRINNILSIQLPLNLLFEKPDVQDFIDYIIGSQHLINTNRYLTIEPRDINTSLILSSSQKRLWFFHQFDPSNPAYNLAQSLEISGEVNINILIKAIEIIISRHDIFKTCFVTIDGEPSVSIEPAAKMNIELLDFSGFSENEKEVKVKEHIIATAATPFRFEQPPLYSVTIYRKSTECCLLVLFIPHIISDGWSFNIFQKELEVAYRDILYNNEISLDPRQIQFADYAVWHENQNINKDYSNQILFWKKYLEQSNPVLQMPFDYDRPVYLKNKGNVHYFELADEKTFSSIKEIGIKYNATNFIFIMTVINILFYKYSGQDTIIIGTPYANRDHEQIEDIMGFFLNMLPLCTKFKEKQTFLDTLRKLMSDFSNVMANRELPFEKLVDVLAIERHENIHPVFQVMVAYQNYLHFSGAGNGLSFQQVLVNRGISEYDISFYIWEDNQKIVGAIEYSTELFNNATIERMLKHLKIIIDHCIVNNNAVIDQIEILTPDEKEKIYNPWNNTRRDLSDILSLPEQFSLIAENNNKIAAASGNEKITYRILNEKSNKLARYLVNHGVKTGDLICILLDRGLNLLVSLMGILKSGATYIPLDPDFPLSRLELMLHDSCATLIITKSVLSNLINIKGDTKKILIDREWSGIEKEYSGNLNIKIDPDSLAYILYTSGSTGVPNGVQISHKSLMNFLLSMKQTPGITEDDVMLALTTLSFDIAGLELFLPLITGARIEIITRDQALDIDQLKNIIEKKQISIMQATPATYQMLFESGWTKPGNLKKILCGGEAMPGDLAEKLIATGSEIWNMYGPTETTIWSSAFLLTEQFKKPYLGLPIANTQFFVLDRNLNHVPVGVPGELYIGGEGVARGYINRPELTAKRFIKNPFTGDSVIYKTGDLVRYLHDGNLEYIGRTDLQTKIRGFRIELEDIETVISQYGGVLQNVCSIFEVNATDKRIVAYIRTDSDINEFELKNFIRGKLPEYFIPNHFCYIKKFPLTPNGKIDRKALPRIDFNAGQTNTYTGLETEIQKRMLFIWENVLERSKISINDNFFNMGGHSLLAAKLIHKLNQEFNVEFKLRDLFTYPTIAGLSEKINSSPDEQIQLLFHAQIKGDKNPLFLVAGVYEQFYYKTREIQTTYENDFLRYFYNLIFFMGTDRPIFGLRPRGIFLNENFHPDVSKMAAEYILEIRKKQPVGPYIIGGECLGGVVAYEIAQQLIRQGDEVGLLILMDTFKTDNMFEIKFRINSASHNLMSVLRNFKNSVKNKKLKYFKNFIEYFPFNFKFYRKVLIPLNSDERDLRRVHFGSKIYAKKLIKYRPKPYTGEVALIINEEWNRQKPNIGWNSKYFTNFSVKIIPGDHTTRLTDYGIVCGKTIKNLIDKI